MRVVLDCVGEIYLCQELEGAELDMLFFDVGLIFKYDLKLCLLGILVIFDICIVFHLFLDYPPIFRLDFLLQLFKRLYPRINISLIHIFISFRRLEIIFLKSLIQLQQLSILLDPFRSINLLSLTQYNLLQ